MPFIAGDFLRFICTLAMTIILINRIGKSEAPTIHFTASMGSEIGKMGPEAPKYPGL
jgi:hypothetical protein